MLSRRVGGRRSGRGRGRWRGRGRENFDSLSLRNGRGRDVVRCEEVKIDIVCRDMQMPKAENVVKDLC